MELLKTISHKQKELPCMNNYSTQLHGLKREIFGFCEKICRGLHKPKRKLVEDVVFGVAAAQSCLLSEIARGLNEEIALKKTIERLGRGLMNFDGIDTLRDNFAGLAKEHLSHAPTFLIDLSDIAKPYGKAFEALAKVHDGSTGGTVPGFWTLEIAALGQKTHAPIPVYDRVFSSIEDGYVSQNAELFTALDWLTKTFGGQGVHVFDRGFDRNIVYEYLLRDNLPFIVRADKQRNVIFKGKTLNILDAAKQYKGKCNLKIRGVDCKTSIACVKLPKLRDVPLFLVMVHGLGEEPLMLLTNLNSTDSKLSNAITKMYLLRWRVEENFRFKKIDFEIEGFRVRKLKAIRALHRMVSLLSGFIALLSEQREDFALPAQLVAASKRIFAFSLQHFQRCFLHYAIADGIAFLLRRACVPLARPKPRAFDCSAQLAFMGV